MLFILPVPCCVLTDFTDLIVSVISALILKDTYGILSWGRVRLVMFILSIMGFPQWLLLLLWQELVGKKAAGVVVNKHLLCGEHY